MALQKVTKSGLIAEISGDVGLSPVQVKQVVDAIFTNITYFLISGKRVCIDGFGTFEPQKRAPRTGRNPHRNTPVPIPARTIPKFTAHGNVLDAMNNDSRKGGRK